MLDGCAVMYLLRCLVYISFSILFAGKKQVGKLLYNILSLSATQWHLCYAFL